MSTKITYTINDLKIKKFDDKRGSLNYLKAILDKELEVKDNVEKWKHDFVAFNNEGIKLTELVDKNYIHECIGLPCRVLDFYGQNFKTIEPLQTIGLIIRQEHPLINNFYEQVINGNMISSGMSFCLQSNLLRDFYNWATDVLDKMFKSYKGTLQNGEIHRILDIIFTSYFICYGNVNKGAIYISRSEVLPPLPPKPVDNGVDINEENSERKE